MRCGFYELDEFIFLFFLLFFLFICILHSCDKYYSITLLAILYAILLFIDINFRLFVGLSCLFIVYELFMLFFSIKYINNEHFRNIVSEITETKTKRMHRRNENFKEKPLIIIDFNYTLEGIIDTTMQTVAIKLCGEYSTEGTDEAINQQRGHILNTFKRRAFNRISFKGDSGLLLNR